MTNNIITSNVLNSIASSIKPKGFSNSIGRALVVFNGSTIEFEKNLKSMQELKSNGIDFSVGFSYMAENILDTNKIINILRPIEVFKEKDIFKLQDISKDHSTIIGPNITVNTLSKVTLGMIDSLIPTLIWTFLYQNKKVFLDFNSVKNYLGNQTNSKEILDITNRNIKTIIKMGAVEVGNSYVDEINIIPDITSKKSNISKKDLITARDIMNLSNAKTLDVDIGTVITPLAKDKARELGIKIQRI